MYYLVFKYIFTWWKKAWFVDFYRSMLPSNPGVYILVTGKSVMTYHHSLAAATVHSGCNPRWRRPCRSGEEVLLGAILGIPCGSRVNYCTRPGTGVQKKTTLPSSSTGVAGCWCGCGKLSVWRWASSPAPSHSEEPWGEEPHIPLQTRTRSICIWRVWHPLQAVDASLQFSDQDNLRDCVCHRPETEKFLNPGWSSHCKVCCAWTLPSHR